MEGRTEETLVGLSAGATCHHAMYLLRFLKDLEDRMFESLLFSDICDIIHYHAQHNFPAYIDYVRNQIYQEKIFSSLM